MHAKVIRSGENIWMRGTGGGGLVMCCCKVSSVGGSGWGYVRSRARGRLRPIVSPVTEYRRYQRNTRQQRNKMSARLPAAAVTQWSIDKWTRRTGWQTTPSADYGRASKGRCLYPDATQRRRGWIRTQASLISILRIWFRARERQLQSTSQLHDAALHVRRTNTYSTQ